jgi:hypothetical protein
MAAPLVLIEHRASARVDSAMRSVFDQPTVQGCEVLGLSD